MRKSKEIELNEEFLKALLLMEEGKRHLLITGRAGTGKSTLLQYFRETTRRDVVFLAPTGVAAVNIGGQTIHSFFGFRPDITPETASQSTPPDRRIYKEIDTIVIDEVSMVRADLLDSIDIFLRKYGRSRRKPFGGVRMIFIGDLYQLPPVVRSKESAIFRDYYRSAYFFDAKVFEGLDVDYVELQKVYRQNDEAFLEILNAIRNKTITEEQLEVLNSRVMPEFEPPEGEFYIYLTTTNKQADEINRKNLKKLKGRKHLYQGRIKGDFAPDALPAPLELELKPRAQVMLLNNDPYGRWINGTMGILVDIEPQGKDKPDILWVELEDGPVVDVLPHRWEMFEYHYDSERKSLTTLPVGTYEQYPLRLAWAITIHKSQGLTFDRVIIDIGRGTFSHGHVYVGLSRCRSLNGLVLKRPLQLKHIWLDRRVVQFITSFQYRLSEKEMPLEEKIKVIEEAIKRKRPLEILYLKAKDERSRRIILPLSLEQGNYRGSSFLALRAYCHLRGEERTFNVKRILELKEAEQDATGQGSV